MTRAGCMLALLVALGGCSGPGDGAAISAESAIALEATSDAEILVFDMA